MNKSYSIGDIVDSRLYVGFQIHRCGKFISFGKTYNGTKAGVVIAVGIASLLIHIR